MKHFRSERAFEKYKPHTTLRKKISIFFAKKQSRTTVSSENIANYKINPFRRTKAPSRTKTTLKLSILLIVISFWMGCLMYLPYFQIQKIEYSGLKNNTKQELNNFIYTRYLHKKSRLPLDNYFFVSDKKITKDLLQNFSFETVIIKKIFPNKITIDVQEKISSIIYDTGKQYFLLDGQGTAIKYLTDVEPSENSLSSVANEIIITSSTSITTSSVSTSTLVHTPNYQKITNTFGEYPILYNKHAADITVKQENILPTDHISSVIIWYNSLNEQGSITPEFFVLDNLNSGIVIKTDRNWDIIFQPKNSIQDQIRIFREILPTIKPAHYVDLRFGEKVYWK